MKSWNKCARKCELLNTNKMKGQNPTACGCLWTISTAFSLLKCSHRPSDANIRKESFGWRGWERIVGLADKIGMCIGSGSLNFALIGSLLNCACFIYTSPIDFDTCTKYNKGVIHKKSPFKKKQNYESLQRSISEPKNPFPQKIKWGH